MDIFTTDKTKATAQEQVPPKTKAIVVEHISKTFRIPHQKIDTMRSAFVNAFQKRTFEEFEALNDVSFHVNKGEFFGIIGRNGSGKSTLLKILAGIYTQDSGDISVNGMISPFLELGIGFNPELSGRDNVYLNAAVLGMSRSQIEKKFDSIVSFAELERFIDQKIKNYSSGMQVRLAFSVAIHANRDILLMDEVLAVGDSNFQQKCLMEFNKYRDQNKTVILVSHDIGTIQRYCDRALLLRNGQVQMVGDPEEVGNLYLKQNMSDEELRLHEEQEEVAKATAVVSGEPRPDNAKVGEITGVEFLDSLGNEKAIFSTGADITVRIHYKTTEKIERPVFGIALHTDDNIHISGPNTKTSEFDLPFIEGVGFIDMVIKSNPFFTGSYRLTVALFEWECRIPYDFQEKKYSFRVMSSEENQHGLFKLDIIWKKN